MAKAAKEAKEDAMHKSRTSTPEDATRAWMNAATLYRLGMSPVGESYCKRQARQWKSRCEEAAD